MAMYCCECDERIENCKCTYSDWNEVSNPPTKEGKYNTLYCTDSGDIVKKVQEFNIQPIKGYGYTNDHFYHWSEDRFIDNGITIYWKDI